MPKSEKAQHDAKNLLSPRNIILLVCGVIVVLVILFLAFSQLLKPGRSVANFCSERTKLVAKIDQSGKKGGSYPSTVFNRTTSDLSLFIDGYRTLEDVAPESIAPDITVVRKGFEEVQATPSKMFSVGVGIASSELRLQDFTKQNCQDY